MATFKYEMGQKDYSKLEPEVKKLLGDSPLAQYSKNFIDAGNTYGVDPRVLITIANNESSLGRNYPTESYNPFGYLADSNDPRFVPDKYPAATREIARKLYGAGFQSLPHAIDALTGRFQRQPTEGYKTFYNDPTIENLQSAYNANPAEKTNYLKNAYTLLGQTAPPEQQFVSSVAQTKQVPSSPIATATPTSQSRIAAPSNNNTTQSSLFPLQNIAHTISEFVSSILPKKPLISPVPERPPGTMKFTDPSGNTSYIK